MMKRFLIFFSVVSFSLTTMQAQEKQDQNDLVFVGVSYGRAFSMGDFGDTDINNPDAGFAQDGAKLDLYGGYNLTDKTILTATFRYQNFETDIDNLANQVREQNEGINFTASTEDWKVYSLLVGVAYKIPLFKKFSVYPRAAIGPMLVTNPGITITSPDVAITQNFTRSSETGFGLGFEAGIGFKTNLHKRFALMPTFTIAGGWATINDVVNTTDNASVNTDYQANVLSFNLGLSLAYRFY
jgi:opacity protein-like surface antigen